MRNLHRSSRGAVTGGVGLAVLIVCLVILVVVLFGRGGARAAAPQPSPEPRLTCSRNTVHQHGAGGQLVCRLNVPDVDPQQVDRFKLTFAINGRWEYVDKYWPCGDDDSLCGPHRVVQRVNHG